VTAAMKAKREENEPAAKIGGENRRYGKKRTYRYRNVTTALAAYVHANMAPPY